MWRSPDPAQWPETRSGRGPCLPAALHPVGPPGFLQAVAVPHQPPRPRRPGASGWGRLPPAARSAAPRDPPHPVGCAVQGRCGPQQNRRRCLPSSDGWRWPGVQPLHHRSRSPRSPTPGPPARGSAGDQAHRWMVQSPCAAARPPGLPAASPPAGVRCGAGSWPQGWRPAWPPVATGWCGCCGAPGVHARARRRWPPGAGWPLDPPVGVGLLPG